MKYLIILVGFEDKYLTDEITENDVHMVAEGHLEIIRLTDGHMLCEDNTWEQIPQWGVQET